jgi:hypothetical protein
MTLASENFIIPKDMLQMDKDTAHKQIKEIEKMELVLDKIPTKAIYKL